MRFNAIIIDQNDNVVTVLKDISVGERVAFIKNGKIQNIVVKENIPFGHKVAIKNIRKGELIIKYGYPIGIATRDIKTGEHVHIHNLMSVRGSIRKPGFSP